MRLELSPAGMVIEFLPRFLGGYSVKICQRAPGAGHQFISANSGTATRHRRAYFPIVDAEPNLCAVDNGTGRAAMRQPCP